MTSSHVERAGGKKSLVSAAELPEEEGGPEEYRPDGCGYGLRSPTLMLRAVAGKRVWRIPYGAFLPGECEIEGDHVVVFSFAMERDDFQLRITGKPEYVGDPERGLEGIIRQIEEGHRRVIRANGDRVVKVEVRQG